MDLARAKMSRDILTQAMSAPIAFRLVLSEKESSVGKFVWKVWWQSLVAKFGGKVWWELAELTNPSFSVENTPQNVN